MDRKVWQNGMLIPEKEARYSIYDTAMMYGTVFEMTRSFRKMQFKGVEHINRLFRSMDYVGIKSPFNAEQIAQAMDEVEQANDQLFEEDDEHRLLIDASHGALEIYKDVVGTVDGPNIMIADFPLRWTVRGMGKLYDTGINAVIPHTVRSIPDSILDNKTKHHNRLNLLRANMEVSKLEGDNNWPLLLEMNGFITEFTGANFFMVKDKILYTPYGDVLFGISREYVMKELCSQLGLTTLTVNLVPLDVSRADECFATATPFCILPVTSLNGQKIGDGKPGFITNTLLAIWSENVGIDIPKQIKDWNELDKDIVKTSPYKFRQNG